MNSRYVALLRGINVGGHRVTMARLRQVFADLGFAGVSSYINSGNVFFDTDASDRHSLTTTIEETLRDALGYDVPTFLRTPDELQAILDLEPFNGIELTADRRFAVVFTSEPLDRTLDLPVLTSRGDMEIVGVNDHEAFVVWHILKGRPPAGKFPPGTLPNRNTTRFFHTLAKILEAARGAAPRTASEEG